MIDTRIYTLLELCKQMNYRKTAEVLNMTQPAVTQHIQHLERQYGCTLFHYANKKLTQTEKCIQLAQHARSIVSLSFAAERALATAEKMPLRLGATKTIGEYTLEDATLSLMCDAQIEFSLTIENTETLLAKLNQFSLDLLVLEGYFDKTQYDYQTICAAELVGICAATHPFANQTITLPMLFSQHVILREQGSGTRAVFENFLQEQNFSIDALEKITTINNYRLIEKAVESHVAISFVYDVIPQKNKNLAVFRIENSKIFHEFNYVFLKNSNARTLIPLMEGKTSRV